MPAVFYKEPEEEVDIFVPWDRWLRPGQTIASATVEADTGITVQSHTINAEADGVTVWTTGGELDAKYEFINEIVDTAGRVGRRRFTVHCTKMYTEKEGA